MTEAQIDKLLALLEGIASSLIRLAEAQEQQVGILIASGTDEAESNAEDDVDLPSRPDLSRLDQLA